MKKATTQLEQIAKKVGSVIAADMILRAQQRTAQEPTLELSIFELRTGDFMMTAHLWPSNAKRKLAIVSGGETTYL